MISYCCSQSLAGSDPLCSGYKSSSTTLYIGSLFSWIPSTIFTISFPSALYSREYHPQYSQYPYHELFVVVNIIHLNMVNNSNSRKSLGSHFTFAPISLWMAWLRVHAAEQVTIVWLKSDLPMSGSLGDSNPPGNTPTVWASWGWLCKTVMSLLT